MRTTRSPEVTPVDHSDVPTASNDSNEKKTNEGKERFGKPLSKQEINELTNSTHSKNTQKRNKWAVNLFNSWNEVRKETNKACNKSRWFAKHKASKQRSSSFWKYRRSKQVSRCFIRKIFFLWDLRMSNVSIFKFQLDENRNTCTGLQHAYLEKILFQIW